MNLLSLAVCSEARVKSQRKSRSEYFMLFSPALVVTGQPMHAALALPQLIGVFCGDGHKGVLSRKPTPDAAVLLAAQRIRASNRNMISLEFIF